MSIRNLVLGSLMCAVWVSAPADDERRDARGVVNIKAANVTGWNRYLGQPRFRWDFLAPPLDLAGANTAGAYNPGADEPLPLTPESPPDTLMASLADPFLEVVFPPFDISVVDPEADNIPIRDVPTLVSSDLIGRATLPFITQASATSASQTAPEAPNPVTLADWFEASGRMRIRCFDDDSAELSIRLKGLLPNRAYTVWAMWYLAEGRIIPQPYGGVPNGYITNERGAALFERRLNFCPQNAARDGIEGNRLLSIITHLHSDHILYGAIPAPSAAGLPPGTVTHMQLEWNFPGSGTPLLD